MPVGVYLPKPGKVTVNSYRPGGMLGEHVVAGVVGGDSVLTRLVSTLGSAIVALLTEPPV